MHGLLGLQFHRFKRHQAYAARHVQERRHNRRLRVSNTAIFEKIKATTIESKHLTDLRDWLLSMLMNGQVRVAASVTERASSVPEGRNQMAIL